MGVTLLHPWTRCIALGTLHDLFFYHVEEDSCIYHNYGRLAMQAVAGHIALSHGRDSQSRQLLQPGSFLLLPSDLSIFDIKQMQIYVSC